MLPEVKRFSCFSRFGPQLQICTQIKRLSVQIGYLVLRKAALQAADLWVVSQGPLSQPHTQHRPHYFEVQPRRFNQSALPQASFLQVSENFEAWRVGTSSWEAAPVLSTRGFHSSQVACLMPAEAPPLKRVCGHLQTLAHLGKTAPDPFAIVKDELETVSERLRRSVLTEVPVLSRAASYFFQVSAACSPRTVLIAWLGYGCC